MGVIGRMGVFDFSLITEGVVIMIQVSLSFIVIVALIGIIVGLVTGVVISH